MLKRDVQPKISHWQASYGPFFDCSTAMYLGTHKLV